MVPCAVVFCFVLMADSVPAALLKFVKNADQSNRQGEEAQVKMAAMFAKNGCRDEHDVGTLDHHELALEGFGEPMHF